MTRRKNILFLASVLLVIFAGWRGSLIPFSEQWPLYEALRNTAAIIFAVVGAWLAIVYPDRLKVSLSNEKKGVTTPRDAERVATLMTPIVHSTFILAAVLLIGVAAPLLKSFAFVQQYTAPFRAASYATLTALTLWQLWTVLLTLVPASDVTNRSNQDTAARSTAQHIFSRARRKPQKGD